MILKALVLSLILPFARNIHALPAGGSVTAGSAGISSSLGHTTITQSSQNVAINWQSFNIGVGETVRFIQPDSSSVALNRVLGPDPSSILGRLAANGKVFLVNPNGILFGRGAQINVGGLVASTLAISDSDFMAGRYRFAGDSTAAVLNQGTIDAPGGYVALLGANVGNDGTILARLGTVALAAGSAVTLDLAGDGLLNVTVSQGAVNALAQNGGLIQADGGQVLLTARAAGSLLQSAVNTSGVIQAESIENHNGTIRLLGDPQGGSVRASGTLDASGRSSGKTGGRITLSGHKLALIDAHIIASGDTGGGSVLIGGDYQGRNPAVPNAAATYMSADSTITADAITHGNGGKVILWSDESTRAYGQITARGGALGGNGGLIETSGHWLDISGIAVNASAPNGTPGSWLLDPNNITIQAAGAEANVTPGPDFSSTDDNATVTTATIEAALNAGTSVIITTAAGGTNAQAGNIIVASPLTWTHAAGPLLTLNATHDVIVNPGAAITSTTGSLVLNAGHNVSVGETTKSTTGNLVFTAGNDVTLNAAATITTGNLTAIAGHDVRVNSPISITTGNVMLRADNDGSGPGAVIGGTVAITCAPNCITITDLAGQLGIRFNPADYTTTNAEISAYGLKLTGGASLDARAWVFGKALDKSYDGTTAASVTSFKPDITATLPPVALGAVANANFDTGSVGANKLVTFDSTFVDPVFALFAPYGTPAGKGTARANVTPAGLTITADNQSKSYGTLFSFTGTEFSASGLQNGETIGSVALGSPGGLATAAVGGNPYTIAPSLATGGSFAASNYTITYTPGVLSVTPAPLTVTSSDVAKVYGTTPVLAAFTSAGLLNGDAIDSLLQSSPGQAATAAVPGPYAITPSAATGATFTPSNYTITYAPGVLSVTPAPLTVTSSDVAKVYGTTPVLSAFTTAGLLNGDAIDSLLQSSPGQAASAAVPGPYAITPSAATGATFTPSNYTITYAPGVLSVTPAPLTVTSSDVSKVYGTTPVLSAFTTAGLLNGDTIDSLLQSSPGQAASAAVPGPYAITPSAATGATFTASNYTITYAPGVLSVTPAPLTVTSSDVSKVYGTTPVLSAFTTAGLLNGDIIDSLLQSSPGQAASAAVPGPYAITPSAATGATFTASNYTITYAPGVLSVTPFLLTGSVTVADKIFDATTAATITGRTLAGVLAADAVTYTGGTALFVTPAPGTGKAVTVSGLGLSGADAGNYTVNSFAATTATISAVAAPPALESSVIGVLDPVVKMMIDAGNLNPLSARLNIPPALMPDIVAARLPPQLSSIVRAASPTAMLPASALAAMAEAQSPLSRLKAPPTGTGSGRILATDLDD